MFMPHSRSQTSPSALKHKRFDVTTEATALQWREAEGAHDQKRKEKGKGKLRGIHDRMSLSQENSKVREILGINRWVLEQQNPLFWFFVFVFCFAMEIHRRFCNLKRE